jgi:hypothetical protein
MRSKPRSREFGLLSPHEQEQLKRLLAHRNVTTEQAEAEIERERTKQKRLQEQSDRLAAEEAKVAKQFADLRANIDFVPS